MRKFEDWLNCRDIDLVETMSKEKMMKHDMDALKAAHDEKRQEDELEEKARAIKYLAGIKKKIEGWVDAHNKGSQSLKLIGAAMLNHSKSKMGIKSNLRKAYNHDLKNLKDLQQIFSHDSLTHHMTDIDALHALHLLLTTDFADQLVGLQNDPMHYKHDHSHGEIGKKFAKFVVDQIKHTADDILASLLGGGHEKEDDAPPPEEKHAAEEEAVGDVDADEGQPQGPDADMGGDMGGDMGADMGGDMPPAPMDQAPMVGAGDMTGGDMGAGAGDVAAMNTPPSDNNALMPPVGMGAAPPAAPQAGQPPMAPPPGAGAPPPAAPMAPPPGAPAPMAPAGMM